ncbi:MAG: hypothetical protein WCY29_09215 [Novosphingobium sp.]
MIRNVSRVDHVAGLVRLENLDSVIERMSTVLQTSFHGPFDRPQSGMRVAVSIDAGIELIAPLSPDPDNPLNRLLAERGEHWVSVVFGVRSMDATCDHLARLGYKPTWRGSPLQGDEPYIERVARMDYASFDPGLFHGLPCILAEIEERGPAG